MKNLLDDTSVIMQGDKITRSYKKGREYSLTLSINLPAFPSQDYHSQIVG
jgi:hypothetical protein